jgi:hypothetical protein
MPSTSVPSADPELGRPTVRVDVARPGARALVEDAVFLALLATCAALYLAPLWTARYLPVLDLPTHLQMASALHNLGNPALGIAPFFELRGGLLPYWTYYGLVDLLAYVLPIDEANRVVLSLIALGLVGGLLLALRGFGRSRWLVFLALPFIYDVNHTYGYFAFRLSVFLGLAGLGLLRADLDRPRTWRELLLAAVALLVFFAHAHGFAVLAVLAAATILLASPSLRSAVRGALALVPALGLSAGWYLAALFARPEGLPGGPAGPSGPVQTPFIPLIRLMELIPHRILNSFEDVRDEAVALVLLVTLAGLVAASPRPRPDPERRGVRALLAGHLPEILTGLMFVAYFAVPNQILTPTQRIYGINYRFLLVVCLLATLVPRVDLRGWRALGVLPAVLASIYFALFVGREYRGFDKRVRGFDRVVEAMRPARRVMAFAYDTRDPRFTVPMLGHFVGYYCARKGGAPSEAHTFATYEYMPLKLRRPGVLPEPNYGGPQNWPLLASRYDYYLIADREGSRRAPFDLRLVRLVAEGGPFRVYEKVPAPARRPVAPPPPSPRR